MQRLTDIKEILFPVELMSAFTEINLNGKQRRIEVPNSRIVINKKNGTPLGVVSSNYRLVTNTEAIELGIQCCRELFGEIESKNIEIFNIYAPKTASYCHIDLVHKNFVMNLWDEDSSSEIYIPYVRVTNSYNTTRALRFDVGLCRKICLNGVIFEAETIRFIFSHVKHEIKDTISFSIEKKRLKDLIKRFKEYATNLKNIDINFANAIEIIFAVHHVKSRDDLKIKEGSDKEQEYIELISFIKKKLENYFHTLGGNAYALFNTLTDLASNPPENHYFRKDINSMQRRSGNWINSFQKEILKEDFDLEAYIKNLKFNYSKKDNAKPTHMISSI